MCCSLPGLSTESRGFSIANSTMMISATSICMATKLAQGALGVTAYQPEQRVADPGEVVVEELGDPEFSFVHTAIG